MNRLEKYYETKVEPVLSKGADIFGYLVIAGGIILIIRMLIELAVYHG